jgi:hypothetical protein
VEIAEFYFQIVQLSEQAGNAASFRLRVERVNELHTVTENFELSIGQRGRQGRKRLL